MPTIDVMPMTTPSTVSAGAQLVGAQRLERHPDDFARARPSIHVAAPRSDRAAPRATPGRAPKKRPTPAVMPMPSTTDHGSSRAGSGVTAAMQLAARKPSAMPTMPPNGRERHRLGQHLRHDVAPLAPSALRRPISRVRSLTTISMMFMMTMPPTTQRQRDDADQHGEDAVGGLLVEAEHRVRREDAEVVGLATA